MSEGNESLSAATGEAQGHYRDARRFPWTPEEDALLGKDYDRIVAQMLQRTLYCVRGRRKYLGVPGLGGPGKPRTIKEALQGPRYANYPLWSIEEERQLGRAPDRSLSRKIYRTHKATKHRREAKRIRLTKKWSSADDKVLGTRPDAQIAALLKRSVTNVAWRRKELGIAPYHKINLWLPEQLALLGTMSDEEAARLTGHPVKSVEGKRIALGRPKFDPKQRLITRKHNLAALGGKAFMKAGAGYCTWTPEEDALLGKYSDAQVAGRLGCSTARVRRRRRLLGVASNNPEHRHWTAKEIALLGTAPDREVGKLVKRSLENVRYKRLQLGISFSNPGYEIWTEDQIRLLGTMPDGEVARITGHSLQSVRGARTRHGILSVRRQAPDWTPQEEALLGTKPDAEVARLLNRSKGAVSLRRNLKGIPVFGSRGGHAQNL